MDTKSIEVAKNMLVDSKFYMGYSMFDEALGRYENWGESVGRVMNMHRKKFEHLMTPELEKYIAIAEEAYLEKSVLGSQRALQFGGEQIFKHESRMYNCSSTYADRPRFFQETMYLLLCGCGVGFSVQKHHVAKLPKITKPDPLDSKVFVIEDCIEGWSDAIGVLLSSYFVNGGEFPEYAGKTVHFDYSKIRPRGAYITGGFKAPGPDGLTRSLEKCRELLSREVKDNEEVDIRPIVAYDFVMHTADAVLSGGIRRAATICIFSKDDEEMLTAKTGNWFTENPQRSRSNNSALLIRDELTREEWADIISKVKEFGEPGFIFASFLEALFNPCVEIGMMGYTESGESGWQKCNL